MKTWSFPISELTWRDLCSFFFSFGPVREKGNSHLMISPLQAIAVMSWDEKVFEVWGQSVWLFAGVLVPKVTELKHHGGRTSRMAGRWKPPSLLAWFTPAPVPRRAVFDQVASLLLEGRTLPLAYPIMMVADYCTLRVLVGFALLWLRSGADTCAGCRTKIIRESIGRQVMLLSF